jgi:septal ring factor EnvC (AmiA/AmiB activator)
MQKIFRSSKLKSSEVSYQQTSYLPVKLNSTKAALDFNTGLWTNSGELSMYTATLEDERRQLEQQFTETRVTKALLEQLLQSKASTLERLKEEVRDFLLKHDSKLTARGVPVAELLEPLTPSS